MHKANDTSGSESNFEVRTLPYFVALIALLFLSIRPEFSDFLQGLLSLEEPRRFSRRLYPAYLDLMDGISAAAVLPGIAAVVLLMRRAYPAHARMAIFWTAVLVVPQILEASYVLIQCADLFIQEPATDAVCTWIGGRGYQADPVRDVLFYGSFAATLAYLVWGVLPAFANGKTEAGAS
jgi:hypothetical protein